MPTKSSGSLSLKIKSGSNKSGSSQEKTFRSQGSGQLYQRKKCGIFTLYDLVNLIVGVLILCIGLGISLALFFNSQLSDEITASSTLNDALDYQIGSINDAIANVERMSKASASFVSLNFDLMTQEIYATFTQRANLQVSGVYASSVFLILPYQEGALEPFLQNMAARDTLYTNMTVFGYDGETKVPYYNYSTSYIYLGGYPLFKDLLGYDIASNDYKLEAIKKSYTTHSISATPKTTLPGQNTSIITLFSTGFTAFGDQANQVLAIDLDISSLLASVQLPGAQAQIIFQVYDVTNNDSFLYSSVADNQVPFQGVKANQMTDAQHVQMKNYAPYFGQRTVRVADRTWNIVFLPTSVWVAQFVTQIKWVFLFVGIAITICIIFIVAVFVKRMEYNNHTKKLDEQRVVSLNQSQEKIQNMMNRISDTERQIRTTINAIPDFITVINDSGRVIVGNTSFDKQFGLTEIDYQRGVLLSTILPDLKFDFFMEQHEFEEITTEARTKFLSRIPVSISVRELKVQNENDESQDEEAYVIVMRNMSDKNKLLEAIQQQEAHMKQVLKYAEFDAQFCKNSRFREGFLKFCKKSRTDENVEFLNQVRKYKITSVEKRVIMQNEIYDKFIRINSKHQLNISLELSKMMDVRVSKSLGDIDLFHEVEEFVKSMIVVDSYPRYLAELKEDSQ